MKSALTDLSIDLLIVALFVPMIPAALLKAPSLVALWPAPVAISGDPVLVSDARIPVLRP